MRIIAIINDQAGGMIGADKDEVSGTIAEVFSEAGHDVEVCIVSPEQVSEIAHELDPGAVDVYLIGGGDGTVRSFAQRLVATKPAPRAVLGILPMGTMNRLARDLDTPLDLRGACRALACAQVHAIDVAEVNGQIYLCSSFIGLPLEYAETRQSLRGKPALRRLTGYLGILRTLFATRRRIALSIDDGRKPRVFRALSLAVSNNPFGEVPDGLPRRPRLDTGKLALYLSTHRNAWALLKLFLLTMIGVLRFKDTEIESILSEKIRIDMKSKTVKVCNDGEVERLELPLRYQIRPASLRVLMPTPSSAVDTEAVYTWPSI